MVFALISSESLAAYPQWLVISCVVLVAIGVLWLLAKILKWSVYLIGVLILVAGAVLLLATFFT
ncbi:MAG TPA: hypothetical protein PLN52_12625 [Opitutaceae bacterium]|nr:hypothetical protein [Opitutaceae bacterium]